MVGGLAAWWRRKIAALRCGELVRLGPVSLLLTRHFLKLLGRLNLGEQSLSRFTTVHVASRSADSRSQPPAGRSVLFLHHCYYNFYYLAQALRRRGWDAISLSLEGPHSPNARHYHGEDVNLFDVDPVKLHDNIERFFATVPDRFRMVHFYGKGLMSFFPSYFDNTDRYDAFPYDFSLLRQVGVRIGYSISGCLDGVAQSSVNRWAGNTCNKCVWQHDPHVCSDPRNLSWGHKVHLMCDVIATEGMPALDYQDGAKCYREPLTTALDPDFWRPDLAIPDRYVLPRASGELIVYHGVGNYALRTRNGRNFKGTGAVIEAVDRLRREGMPVRLEFVTDVPNTEVRFVQAQADVIVDQLNYGRFGATAREGMMLGKPTICYINPEEPRPDRHLRSIQECPLVSATEETVYHVLKDLLQREDKRRAIGAAGRAFALKWHSAEACAQRFEALYDRLMAGLSVGDANGDPTISSIGESRGQPSD